MARLLHGLQDFYSHSNYVEFETEKLNESLGRLAVAGQVANLTTRTCRPCFTAECKSVVFDEILKTRTLTSGYFSETKPIGKCRYLL
jgi:hypothetical protein